jgi:hypothetical protein
MLSVVFVAGLCAIGLAWQFFQWKRGRASSQFVLVILPAALLVLTVSIPHTVWQLVDAFRRIAERGSGGLAVVAPFCIAIDRALSLASLLCLVIVAAAGMLQALAGQEPGEPQPVHDATSARSRARRWVVVTSTLLAVPALLLSYLTPAIPRLVMQVGTLAAGVQLSPEVTQQASATIANQTVLAIGAALVLSFVLAASAIANLFAGHSRAALDSLDRFSWVVLTGLGLWVAWCLVRLSTDLSTFKAALT